MAIHNVFNKFPNLLLLL